MLKKIDKKAVLLLHRKSSTRPEIIAAVKAARNAGHRLEVLVTWNRKQRRQMVDYLLKNNVGCIIAGGGDGSLGATVEAMLASKHFDGSCAFGILPTGTANDFANGVGLPLGDYEECLKIACTHEPKPCDIGTMNDRLFLNVASGGFGAEVTATTPQDIKRVLGGVAYSIMGLVKLWDLEPYTGELHLPGQAPLKGSMLIMAVGNGRLAGGGFEVAPRAQIDDGLLDLMILRKPESFSPSMVAAELEDPKNPDNQIVFYRQAPHFSMKTDRPLHVNLDGEPVLASELEFGVKRRAIQLIY